MKYLICSSKVVVANVKILTIFINKKMNKDEWMNESNLFW